MVFQYYLQYVYGNLKYHVRYNTFSVLVNVPLIMFLAVEYGSIGVAWLWFGFRVLSLLIWVPFVHNRFAPWLHMVWFMKEVLSPFSLVLGVVFVSLFL